MILVLIGSLFFLARSAMRTAVTRFTTEQPVAVPTVSFDATAKASADAKLAELRRLLDEPSARGEVTLSQTDLLGMLGGTPFSGKLFMGLHDDAVSGTFSFPMTALGDWNSAKPIIGDHLNRFITGEARAKVAIVNGVVSVTFESLVLNGQHFDGDALKDANEWVSGFLNTPSGNDSDAKKRARIESARIAHGQVVIAVKPE
jgi:hypothetical protein